MPFRIALSGLNAASADLKITANNIANANTTGFKSSRGEFVDIFAVSYGGVSATAIGGGTRIAAVKQQFSQGNIDFTDNNLDMALSGQGFFILDDNGVKVYSRAGAFSVDKDGYVINSSAQKLQVFSANQSLTGGTTFKTGEVGSIQLATSEGAPSATSSISTIVNLNAGEAAMPAVPAFDPNNPNTYNSSTSLTIYDSLGTQHTATQYFRKAGLNSWQSYLYVADPPGAAPTNVPIAGGAAFATLNFNPDGTLDTATSSGLAGVISYDPYPALPATSMATGADLLSSGALPLKMDYTKIVQYGSPFSVNSLSQNGYTSGRLSGIDVSADGVVSARFTNGQSQILGKIALANFPNPNGLSPQGDTTWGEAFAAGTRLLGEPGTGSFGLIQSGALETSNVDVAEQLVNLITAQRNFQANAQVITTADAVTQTIINIR